LTVWHGIFVVFIPSRYKTPRKTVSAGEVQYTGMKNLRFLTEIAVYPGSGTI